MRMLVLSLSSSTTSPLLIARAARLVPGAFCSKGDGSAGDCRAVLVQGGRAVQLTRAHTADDPDEQARVQDVNPAALRRVGNGWRIGGPGLQVTRWVSCKWVHGATTCQHARRACTPGSLSAGGALMGVMAGGKAAAPFGA